MFIENEYPPADAVYRVYDYLRTLDADPIELTQAEIKEAIPLDLNESAIGTALRILESSGALERFRPRENMAIVRINAEPDEPRISDRVGANAHVQKLVALGIEGLVNRRFGEPVYFHPDEFATTMGLDRIALGRAIKLLAAEFPIDYVPPFRGNAVRILDRKKRARDLRIDFSALNKRKNQEYEKLERMVRYAETRACRRAFILGYFGDLDASDCGRCDNCGGPGEARVAVARRPIDTPAGREVIQKILSGVARTKGRFGKIAVSQMLVGSGSEKMEKSGLTRLSTFGILARSGFTQKDVTEILDGLLAIGLVASEDVDRFKPVVKLSETGWSWIRDAESPALNLPIDPGLIEKIRNGGLERFASSAASLPSPAREATVSFGMEGEADPSSSSPMSDASGDPLHDRLRRLRLDLSRETGLSPAYVFSNETLTELVRNRPRSPQALGQIKGIGPAKLERFGGALLQAIASEAGPAIEAPKPPRPEPPPTVSRPVDMPAPPQPAARGSSYVPTEEWTWKLLERGFSFEEASAIRGLEVAAIVRHATWMAQKGKKVAPEAFLSAETLGRWRIWLRDCGSETPPSGSADEMRYWPLFVACERLDATD
jgi:ATP-dependent DNA helicase RecQ